MFLKFHAGAQGILCVQAIEKQAVKKKQQEEENLFGIHKP
jgi:hypothetical protein